MYKCWSTFGYKINYSLLKGHLFGHTGVAHTEAFTWYNVTFQEHYFQIKSHVLKDLLAHCCSRKLSSRAGRRPHNAAPVSVHPVPPLTGGSRFPHAAPAEHDHRPRPLSVGPSPAPAAKEPVGSAEPPEPWPARRPDLGGPGQLQGRGASSVTAPQPSDGGAGRRGRCCRYAVHSRGAPDAADGGKTLPEQRNPPEPPRPPALHSHHQTRPAALPHHCRPAPAALTDSPGHQPATRTAPSRADWQPRAPTGGQNRPTAREGGPAPADCLKAGAHGRGNAPGELIGRAGYQWRCEFCGGAGSPRTGSGAISQWDVAVAWQRAAAGWRDVPGSCASRQPGWRWGAPAPASSPGSLRWGARERSLLPELVLFKQLKPPRKEQIYCAESRAGSSSDSWFRL